MSEDFKPGDIIKDQWDNTFEIFIRDGKKYITVSYEDYDIAPEDYILESDAVLTLVCKVENREDKER
jgi:hypothetical protein